MKYLNLIAVLLSFNVAFAKEGGNGGGVCVKGKKAQLYDFVEGQDSLGHGIKLWKLEKKFSMNDYLERALNHIQQDIPEVQALVRDQVKKIVSQDPRELFVDVSIPIIEDATRTKLSRDCQYQQAANWNERYAKLFISKDLFGRLDEMNKAGLIIHEAVYKLSRKTNVATENSDQVRQVVAKIFSDETLTKNDAEVISSYEARVRATIPACHDFYEALYKLLQYKTDENASKINESINRGVTKCLDFCLAPDLRAKCESLRQ